MHRTSSHEAGTCLCCKSIRIVFRPHMLLRDVHTRADAVFSLRIATIMSSPSSSIHLKEQVLRQPAGADVFDMPQQLYRMPVARHSRRVQFRIQLESAQLRIYGGSVCSRLLRRGDRLAPSSVCCRPWSLESQQRSSRQGLSCKSPHQVRRHRIKISDHGECACDRYQNHPRLF